MKNRMVQVLHKFCLASDYEKRFKRALFGFADLATAFKLLLMFCLHYQMYMPPRNIKEAKFAIMMTHVIKKAINIDINQ
ncbi:hypothetical protein L596_024702 [Steinernema carpocapsae]|uniref:Uncharacterized protein n=1 Tax=Steinernema carpocapsae TaxID=34508 RepID=A0A4U5M5I4_STECR|nr:hypothetical protein L596_024702 [Steinernema carpocapsae]